MGILGTGFGSSYPSVIDTRQTWTNIPGIVPDSSSRMDAEMVNDFADAILSIQNELGVIPSGTFTTVAERLNQYLPTSGTFPQGRILIADSTGRIGHTSALVWSATMQGVGINASVPTAPLDVRNLGGDNSFNVTVRVADSGNGIAGLIGIRHVSANYRQGLKLSAPSTLTLHAGTGNIEFQTGPVTSEALDDNARVRIWSSGAVTVGNAAGGPQATGSINCVAVYDDGLLLTSYPLAFHLDGALDLEYWDSRVPGDGQHTRAREFVGRAERDTDIKTYTAYWRANRHLPSMPNPYTADPEIRYSMGEIVQALWETLDLHAIHLATLDDRLQALEDVVYGP